MIALPDVTHANRDFLRFHFFGSFLHLLFTGDLRPCCDRDGILTGPREK
jgi:hypothetical protein